MSGVKSRAGAQKREAPYGLFGLLVRVVLLLLLLTTALNMLVDRTWPPHMTERFLVVLNEPHDCQDFRTWLERDNPGGVNFRVQVPPTGQNGSSPADHCWLEVDGLSGRVDLGERARPVIQAAHEFSDSMNSIGQRIEPRLGEVQPLIIFLFSLLISTLLVVHHRHRASKPPAV